MVVQSNEDTILRFKAFNGAKILTLHVGKAFEWLHLIACDQLGVAVPSVVI